jgi:hypothetical protein
MSRNARQTTPNPKPAFNTDRLIVVGERRKETDWDVAILLAHSLRRVGADLDDLGDDDV